MDGDYNFDSIALDTFQNLLDEYPKVVEGKLTALDHARYETIPKSLQAHKGEADGVVTACLSKAEVLKLVDWKLAHGTFRPSLRKLVDSNDEKDVEFRTRIAYDILDKRAKEERERNAMLEVSAMRGIGPATASLILSVYDPVNMPFFSDELFRWASWEGDGAKGWQRMIKYTPKEYLLLLGRVRDFRARLQVPAVEIEKVAYVLGKRKVGSNKGPNLGSATAGNARLEDIKDGPDHNAGAAPEAVTKNKSKKRAPSGQPKTGSRSSKRIRKNVAES